MLPISRPAAIVTLLLWLSPKASAWQPVARPFGLQTAHRHVGPAPKKAFVVASTSPTTASQRSHSSHTDEERHDVETSSLWKELLCATVSAVGLVWFPLSTVTTSLPAYAAIPPPMMEQSLQSTKYTASTTTTTTTTTSSLGSLTFPSWVSSFSLATEKEEEVPQSAVDEAWTLIDKYYLDRSFNNQDWKTVRDKYINSKDETKALTEMVASLGDRYSRVLTADQYAAIQKYDLIGVGATLMANAEKKIMVGAPPIPGSAAAKANLEVGDIVQAVNGVATDGRTAFDIIDQIAEDDPNAATITLTIRKKGTSANEAVDYVLARQFQKVQNPVAYKVTETRPDGTKVGYVRIAEFNALVKPSLEDALRNLGKEGANALVLDLRGNGGGAFQSAVEISSLFLNESPSVATYVVDGTTAEIPFKSSAGRALVQQNNPLVIWMDGRTASASEVLAAALHDNCRATLAGQPSFGKGLIQAVYGLKNGAGLVLTVAKYVTPKHDEIQGVGLQPDVQGMVPGTLLPGLYSSDTSQVDFGTAEEKIKLCQRPEKVPSARPAPVNTAATAI